jgi:hypothetical protein
MYGVDRMAYAGARVRAVARQGRVSNGQSWTAEAERAGRRQVMDIGGIAGSGNFPATRLLGEAEAGGKMEVRDCFPSTW